MKKILTKLAILTAVIAVTTSTAFAQLAPYDLRIQQRNSTNTATNVVDVDVPPSNGDGIFGVQGSTENPLFMLLGSGLSFDGTYLNVSAMAASSTINDVFGLQSALNSKASTSSLAAVAFSGNYSDLIGLPTISTSSFSGLYSDLVGKPSLSAVATSGAYADLSGKPSIPTVQAYEGTTQRLNSFPIFKSGTVSSGTVVFNLTNDGTSGGTALFPNGVIQDSVNLTVNDATAAYQMSWAWSNSNKTLTVIANKLTTANILTGILGQGQANSSVIKLSVWGY